VDVDGGDVEGAGAVVELVDVVLVVVVEGVDVVVVEEVEVVDRGVVVVGAGVGPAPGVGKSEHPASNVNERARASGANLRFFMLGLPLFRSKSLPHPKTLLHLRDAGGRSSRQVQGNGNRVRSRVCDRSRACWGRTRGCDLSDGRWGRRIS